MSNKLRSMKRKMTQEKMKSVPVIHVPIFRPIMDQITAACGAMDRDRLKAWEQEDDAGRIRAEAKGKEHVELPKPAKVDPISLINSTMAQAAGEFLKGTQTPPLPREPGLIQVVGGDVAKKLKEGEKKIEQST